jgi:hypothetical protein
MAPDSRVWILFDGKVVVTNGGACTHSLEPKKPITILSLSHRSKMDDNHVSNKWYGYKYECSFYIIEILYAEIFISTYTTAVISIHSK